VLHATIICGADLLIFGLACRTSARTSTSLGLSPHSLFTATVCNTNGTSLVISTQAVGWDVVSATRRSSGVMVRDGAAGHVCARARVCARVLVPPNICMYILLSAPEFKLIELNRELLARGVAHSLDFSLLGCIALVLWLYRNFRLTCFVLALCAVCACCAVFLLVTYYADII